jgi:hypothetical protein
MQSEMSGLDHEQRCRFPCFADLFSGFALRCRNRIIVANRFQVAVMDKYEFVHGFPQAV